VVGFVDYFQWRGREVAGSVGASGDGQELDLLRNKSKENVIGGSGERGGDRGEEEARGSPAALDSGGNGRWYLRLR
jgi:hypothetical protein